MPSKKPRRRPNKQRPVGRSAPPPASKKARRRLRPRTIILLALLILFITTPALLFYFLIQDIPSPGTLVTNDYPVSTQIYDRHGSLLYEIFSDTNRTPVALDSLPAHVKQATIAIEDQDFYHHFGFSLQGIIRALKNTLFEDKLQGGSTITQQLVKNVLLTPERTLTRKAKEAILTLGTELRYSKNEILEMYLNHVPYGGTAYGIEAAAQRFFKKPATQLTLPEASILAGLPQAPSLFSPFTNPERAKARQHEVLRRMAEDGYLTQEEADHAFQTPLSYTTPSTDIKAPHFVFYVKELLERTYGIRTVEQGGLRVTTTLDLNLQEYAQASVSAHIKSLENQKVSNGAALITKPDTGEILAMVGSIDFFDTDHDGQVNLTNRLRQPGSSIKPINYVTALQTKKLTPSSMILDLPTCFQVAGQAPYCPRNYDGSFHGPVQFRFALANSYNIPAVKVLAINGVETMIATASAMGIQSFNQPDRYGLSLTLGGGEVTMLDMATAFGTLANLGVKNPLRPILKVETYQGNVLESYHPQTSLDALKLFHDEDYQHSNLIGHQIDGLTRALNREPAYLMWHILSDNSARTPVFGPNSPLHIRGKKVAAKTGTTNDWRDNWTIGYTPQYVIVTWAGNNDNTPMSYAVAGITGAAPMFQSLMSHVLDPIDPSDTDIDQPSGVNGTNVCTLSGVYPTDQDPCDVRYEYFWQERFPNEFNATRQAIWVFKHLDRPAFAQGTDTPPPDINTDELEAREHIILSDSLTKEFCLDCDWLNPETGRLDYPRTTVNMSSFYFSP